MSSATAVDRIKPELVEEVVGSARTLWDLELTSGLDAGDTSLRDPETGYIYILPRPRRDRPIANWSEVDADYIAVIDGGGTKVGGRNVEPTVEVQTHLGIYAARSDVNVIVHTHGEWSQIFSVMRWDIPTFTSETFLVGGLGSIKCAPTGGVATDECARQAVDALGQRSMAALLPSHGAVCVGTTFADAFHVARMVERAARQATFIRLLGGAPQLTLEDLMSPESYEQLRVAADAAGESMEAMLSRSL